MHHLSLQFSLIFSLSFSLSFSFFSFFLGFVNFNIQWYQVETWEDEKQTEAIPPQNIN
jgi:hypothetical protein